MIFFTDVREMFRVPLTWYTTADSHEIIAGFRVIMSSDRVAVRPPGLRDPFVPRGQRVRREAAHPAYRIEAPGGVMETVKWSREKMRPSYDRRHLTGDGRVRASRAMFLSEFQLAGIQDSIPVSPLALKVIISPYSRQRRHLFLQHARFHR